MRAGRGRSPFWTGQRGKLGELFRPASQDCQPIHEQLLRHLFTQCTNAACLFVGTSGVFAAPPTFPFIGVKFRHTLRVSRGFSLAVPDNQRWLGQCTLFPAPLVCWACSSFQCLDQPCCVLHVCCIHAFFGAHVQTVVSLVPTAFGSERQLLHVSEEREPPTSFLRPRTCASLSSSLPSLSC